MEPVPAAEITLRVEALQKTLAPAGIGLALIRQPADLFYYAGTLVDGFLAVAPEGQPSLLVRRPHHRNQSTPGPWPRVLYRDLKELPQALAQAGLEPQGAVALELDVVPAALFRRMQEQLFPGHPIVDLSPFIRAQRMVKSAYEMTQLDRAAAILDQVHEQVPALLKPGMSELEVSADPGIPPAAPGSPGFGAGAQLGSGGLLWPRPFRRLGIAGGLYRHPQRRSGIQRRLSPGAVLEKTGP